jgi:sterol desaturase/sphingolipid hydroxylase (fatty acid hydroxylase superfamily)
MVPDWLSLHDLITWGIKLGWGIFGFFSPRELLSWINILGGLGVILGMYGWARRRGLTTRLREFVFPAAVWTHPSARLDLVYFVVIQAIFVVLIIPVVGLVEWSSSAIEMWLEAQCGSSPLVIPLAWAQLIYTLALFIAMDFGFFYSHYLSHKYPLLWCFHKVHHSAEVLVPFTAARFHPLDMLWNVLFSTVFTSVLSGLLRYALYPELSEIKLFGNNLVIALSYLTTHNLRHMHLWLHYPRWLNRWLISPAQHQIHHSRERRHWDKNMGYLLPCWDRWFGTLYTPSEKEEFAYGVEGMPSEGLRAHRNIRSLLIAPFLDANDYWRRR